ncbi:MAG: SGNH/GDSL hydrolase family protein [Anaerolineae bacterium]|nr:SGNH/GDSL hydrolase family protein [Anaerolineae bacterium]
MISVLLVIAAGFAALAGLAAQQRWRRVRAIGQRALVSFGTLVVLLAVGEAYFRFLYAAPEGRLASNNWMARYWHTNSAGFRDREWQEADWRDKTTIAVVGDSFTAGWGIVDPADRFADVLAQRLGDAYAVFNLGVPGASTPEEQHTLERAPDPTPDVVILQYFLNDIDYAVLTLGVQPADTAPPITHES